MILQKKEQRAHKTRHLLFRSCKLCKAKGAPLHPSILPLGEGRLMRQPEILDNGSYQWLVVKPTGWLSNPMVGYQTQCLGSLRQTQWISPRPPPLPGLGAGSIEGPMVHWLISTTFDTLGQEGADAGLGSLSGVLGRKNLLGLSWQTLERVDHRPPIRQV